MNKQDFNNFFASLMAELGKNKTGRKMLRNVVGSALALAGLEQAAQADIVTTFNYTGNLQTFTVPTTGWYEFTAYGAQGGNGNAGGSTGGFGAEVGGKFHLTGGSILDVLVGGQGQNAIPGDGGGGGGGSFVFQTFGFLLNAGGGGGGGGDTGKNGGAGSANHYGGNGYGAGGGRHGGHGSGGTYGYGDGYPSPSGGGPGGGLYSSGFGPGTGSGAKSGGAGGIGWSAGGFGGGGAGYYGGGGGGGWSGGGGGGNYSVAYGGGGGGSYTSGGSYLILLSGVQAGNGLVKIDELGGVQSVPEPSAVSLFGFGLAVVGAGFAVRRRRELVGR